MPQPPEIVEGEPEYEVKEVLDSKIRGRKVWYFVDWVGYRPEERTWEPADHLSHANDAIIFVTHNAHHQPTFQTLAGAWRMRRGVLSQMTSHASGDRHRSTAVDKVFTHTL